MNVANVMRLSRKTLVLAFLPSALFLNACGGGGGGGSSSPATSSQPAVATLEILSPKVFRFAWSDAAGATRYRLLENPDGMSGFTQVGSDVPAGAQRFDYEAPLHLRLNAQYMLETCFGSAEGDCRAGNTISVTREQLNEAIGYFKASNTEGTPFFPLPHQSSQEIEGDQFGSSVSLSDDGHTMAVGARYEDSAAIGINGDQTENCNRDGIGRNCALDSGAVYVFAADDNGWAQQAYIKASNTGATSFFGVSTSLSADGNTLAVGAHGEGSAATGVNGNETYDCTTDTPASNCMRNAGAVYVFVRSGNEWLQQAYIKASNNRGDGSVFLSQRFGGSVNLSADGNTLAVGAPTESSSATGINGDQEADCDENARGNKCVLSSGAGYVFTRNDGDWSQQAYIKASNTSPLGFFGISVSLSADGNTLAISAPGEGSAATGIDGNQVYDCDQDGFGINCARNSGAVYVFTNVNGSWSQEAYVKASNTGRSALSETTHIDFVLLGDHFGESISLSDDGATLAVGARGEDSAATGIDGDQLDDCDQDRDNCAADSGAVYVFSKNSGGWSQQAYIKASNTGGYGSGISGDDGFGTSVSLSDDGNVLAVGAAYEDGGADGIGGEQMDDCASGDDNCDPSSGAAYVFTRSGGTWTQQAYIKASNTSSVNRFGLAISLSSDGNALAVTGDKERSAATGINGDQTPLCLGSQATNCALDSGAVYLY